MSIRTSTIITGTVALVACLLGVAGFFSAPSTQADIPRLNLEMTVTPKDAARSEFLCHLYIYDMSGVNPRLVPATIDLTLKSGQAGVVKKEGTPNHMGYDLSMKIDPTTDSAIYLLSVTDNKSLLFMQKGTIYLKVKA